MASSFLEMERIKPGSCDLFVTRLLQRLARLVDSHSNFLFLYDMILG